MQPQIKRVRLDSAVVATVAPVCQLFRLPRELLELVAACFSQGEAVPVLAVNSVFHEIFAERIWRRFDADLISSMTAPLESLAIYGHLVRHLRITESIPESIDLATMFPNITHLWIPFIELADTIKSSQGKCFERLSWLSTWAVAFHYHALKVSDSIGSVLNWLDSRFKAEAGLEKVEWELYDRCEMQLQHKILKWFQHNDQLSRIQFKFIGEPLDFNDAKHADLNKIIAHRLVDWKIDDNDDQCAAERFSRVLDSIPLAERQHFQFSALKRLEIGTCCEVGDDVYLQFNFGVLFPFVQELSLDTTIDYCQDYSEDAFGAILAHPWPSVRRLDLYGEFSFNSTVSHLVAVPNVEELSMILDDDSDYEEMGIVDLCELDRTLPKLVRLQVTRFTMVSAPQQHSQQHQIFCHLRHVGFGRLAMTSSAISALVHAPVLTDICMEYVIFENGGDVGISDEDEDEDEDGSIHRMDSARSLDFLSGVANTTVRFVDIYVGSEHVSTKYEDTLSAMLKCFVRLAACTIQSNDREAVPGLRKEFANVKFKHLNWL